MNYYNLPCPVCGGVFKDGDDIVVCPECATPHHRECWHSNGCCVNSELHSTDFVWKRKTTKAEESAPETQTPETQIPFAEENPEVTVCHICGSENPKDALHCGNCGALFGETENPVKKCHVCGTDNPAERLNCHECGAPLSEDGGNPFMSSLGIDENEKIGDYTAGDYALYTQLNAKRYIPKFRNIENGKLTFNWGAFLFGASWFLFRKIYKVGIILLTVFVSVTMMTAPLQDKVLTATDEFYSQSQPLLSALENPETASTVSEEQLMQVIDKYYSSVAKPMFILGAILLLERLVCGFIADKIYYKKINADLKIIDETVEDPGVRNIMIARRGSVSFLAYFAASLGEQALLSIFVSLADMLSGVI